ncbi:unnamed protein product [Schistocephalus solidus]|uniref:CHY-type domain-containing protein n=1 Tax=Schistocephalus solidus TaxID=70667 RepID=A0A183SFI0_SCHSO|nr:unnamed protein product [Schistocephalus solidus]
MSETCSSGQLGHVNEATRVWIAERAKSYQDSNKVALYLRPFFFWIDKKLLELFNEGFQKFSQAVTNGPNAGSDVVEEEEEETGTEPIPDRFSTSLSSSSSEDSYDSEGDLIFNTQNQRASRTSAPVPQSSNANREHEEGEGEESMAAVNTQTSPFNKPTDAESATLNFSAEQQRLSFDDLEFRGQAGACLLTCFSTTVSCTRCKYVFSWVFRLPPQTQQPVAGSSQISQFQSLPPITSACMRCRQSVGLIFEAQLAHSFSSVVGNFCVANCTVVDVQMESTEATVHCTKCSSSVKMQRLKPDQLNAKRCLKCHSPCGLTFSNITLSPPTHSFSELTKRFASLSTKSSVQSSKPPKNTNRMDAHASASSLSQAHLIQKGTPLPDNGTCKHYRKSYRWFRFQCCNRIYPCDVCHNNEMADDHELVFANRMICGFCSKEQPYTATHPCIVCHKTLSGSHTSHWEGGKGCRDQTKMSRKDAKKYANLSKTK